MEKAEKVKKVKYNIKIDTYENGAGVTIKSKNKKVSKVFEGKDYDERYAEWIDDVCSLKGGE